SAFGSTVCEKQNLNLFSNTSAGLTYTWTGPAGFMSTVQNPVIAGSTTLMTGNYVIVVTSAAGCTNSANAAASVVASPTPVIVSNNPLCSGLTLSLGATGGVNYTWQGPGFY